MNDSRQPDAAVTASQPPHRIAPPTSIPALRELAGHPRWVLFRNEPRNGRSTKRPIQCDGRAASSTDPATWCTYANRLPPP